MNEDRNPPVDLLWTGGWDSTFRLLKLVHGTGAVIQPWYVVDETRPTIGREMSTMRQIRSEIEARDPAGGARILPTRFEVREQIPPSEELTGMYLRLKQHVRVGLQYDYLARLAFHHDLTDLELGIHDPEHWIGAAVMPYAQRIETPHGPTFRMVGELSRADADLALFQRFGFPLLGMSKGDMGLAARENGFDDLLEMSWFCYHPRGKKPCGRCRPCQQVIHERMWQRLPPSSRVLGQLRMWRRQLVGVFRKRP